MTRYPIAPDGNGPWAILNSYDDGLGWSGQCWVNSKTGARLISFINRPRPKLTLKELLRRLHEPLPVCPFPAPFLRLNPFLLARP